MNNRASLINLLMQYHPLDSQDRQQRDRILEFVDSTPDCFERSHSDGHVTGSAWLVDKTGKKTLLTLHKKLNKWLQMGGHADGDPNVLNVAMREVQEESGIRAFKVLSSDIFDLDVHQIPATEQEPAHWHYDIRFLFQTVATEAYNVSLESHTLAWIELDLLENFTVEESVLRMKRKWELFRTK